MDEIEKLSNVEYVVTEEVLKRQWLEVYAKRNKLLSMSDWTQIADVDMPQSVRNLWRKWRQKLRVIKRSSVKTPEQAMSLLANLERQIPQKLKIDITTEEPTSTVDYAEIGKYVDEHLKNYESKIISMDDVSNLFEQKLNKTAEFVLENVTSVVDKRLAALRQQATLSGNIDEAKNQLKAIVKDTCSNWMPFINYELVNEAIDYLSGMKGNYPLLVLHVKHKEKDIQTIAADIIKDKQVAHREICQIEEYRLKYLAQIDKASSYDELLVLYRELTNGH
jgi:hypothetical protein